MGARARSRATGRSCAGRWARIVIEALRRGLDLHLMTHSTHIGAPSRAHPPARGVVCRPKSRAHTHTSRRVTSVVAGRRWSSRESAPWAKMESNWRPAPCAPPPPPWLEPHPLELWPMSRGRGVAGGSAPTGRGPAASVCFRKICQFGPIFHPAHFACRAGPSGPSRLSRSH